MDQFDGSSRVIDVRRIGPGDFAGRIREERPYALAAAQRGVAHRVAESARLVGERTLQEVLDAALALARPHLPGQLAMHPGHFRA